MKTKTEYYNLWLNPKDLKNIILSNLLIKMKLMIKGFSNEGIIENEEGIEIYFYVYGFKHLFFCYKRIDVCVKVQNLDKNNIQILTRTPFKYRLCLYKWKLNKLIVLAFKETLRDANKLASEKIP